MAHMRCMLDKQGYMHVGAWTRPRAHNPVTNAYCFSMAAMIRERASMLHYTYIACLVCVAYIVNRIKYLSKIKKDSENG